MVEALAFSNISWPGVAVGALVLFVLGGIWYTVLFGRAYRTELGVSEQAAKEGPKDSLVGALIGQAITSAVMATALAWMIGQSSPAVGAIVGFGAGVLVGAALIQLYQFEGRSIRHLFINIGYFAVGFTGVGAIIGAFQAG